MDLRMNYETGEAQITGSIKEIELLIEAVTVYDWAFTTDMRMSEHIRGCMLEAPSIDWHAYFEERRIRVFKLSEQLRDLRREALRHEK